MTDEPLDLDNLAEEDDPRTQLWERIAEGLATLSEASETPETIASSVSVFTGSDVDMTSDSWIPRLGEVQGWLNFSRDLPTGSTEAFLEALVGELGLDPAAELDRSHDDVRLTLRAWEHLDDRVETAGKLQQQFLDQRANGTSRKAATESWQDAWAEDEHDGEPVSPEPVTAKADVWHILQLTKKKLNLTPTYQRGDVWSTKDRQALIESILRGIPLPSIILLRMGGSAPHEVVDGKQRLTAILRFVGAHPKALERVQEAERLHPGKELLKNFTEDYPKFRRGWKTLMGENLTASKEDEYYFPFKLRNSGVGGLVGTYLEPLRGKYFTQIKDRVIRVADQEVDVAEIFEGAPDYKVPVIEYTSAKQRQIHEVFKLYNKQGVHLNAEELRNAVYHDIELTRAILFAAGDADPHADVAAFAPSLAGLDHLAELGKSLEQYKFGRSRYKRTKVLAWALATLLHDTGQESLKSTASHIDDLLGRTQKDSTHPLRDTANLTRVFGWIARAVELHSGHDELWAPRFKDGENGVKWQELQLVGSLVGVALALAASPDDVEDRMDDHADEIRDASSSAAWERPEKTQTRTQWDYIARIAEQVLLLLDLDPGAATQAVRDRFGSSGYESLQRTRI